MSRFALGTQLDRLFEIPRSASGRKRRKSRPGLFLGMESLEDRALLTTVTVDVVNFAFNPTPVTIHVGDTVHWVWLTDNHSTTSVAGSIESWDSGIHNTGFTFDHTFEHAGTYIYYCRIHGIDNGNGTASFMAAEIDVAASAPALQSIAVTPSNPTVLKGATQQFTAIGTFSDNSTQNLTTQVTWASATPGTATINAATGLATGVTAGTSTITATKGSVVGSTVLNVNAPTLTSIAVTPVNQSIAKGKTEQYTATGTFSDNSTQNVTDQVTWSSSTTTTATINPTTGLATGTGLGTTSISASLSGLTGSTGLTVTAATLASIALTPSNPSIAKGETDQFTATGTFTDNSTQDLTNLVTWASASPLVATIDSGTGLATGSGVGTSSISATMNGVTGSTGLTVTPATLASIAVTPSNPSIHIGVPEQFTATGTFSDESTQDLTNEVTWVSGTSSVATITPAGVASGLAAGTSSIGATFGSITGQTLLTIDNASLVSIVVTPTNLSLAKGTTEAFTATGTFSDDSIQDLTGEVTWTSSTASIATISATGQASGLATGTSTISATLGGITGTAAVTISPAALLSISVTPSNPSVPQGETVVFTATGTYSDSTIQDLSSQVTWGSANTAVATISAAGLASGAEMGTTSISATLGAVTAQTVLTVSAAALLSIAVTPANPSIIAGQSEPFTALGTFSNQSTQDLTSQVTWGSANTSVAIINSAGVATGLSPGTTTTSAKLGGVTGTTLLKVTPSPTPAPTPSPTPSLSPPPALAAEQRLFTGKGARRKLVGFKVSFSTALDAGAAENVGNYHVVQPGLTKHSRLTVVTVRNAVYSAATNSVTLTLGKYNAKKPLTLTATGLIGATGTPSATIVTKL